MQKVQIMAPINRHLNWCLLNTHDRISRRSKFFPFLLSYTLERNFNDYFILGSKYTRLCNCTLRQDLEMQWWWCWFSGLWLIDVIVEDLQLQSWNVIIYTTHGCYFVMRTSVFFSRASHKFHQCFCRCTIWSSFILYLILHFTWPLSSPNKNIVIIISIWYVFLKTIWRFILVYLNDIITSCLKLILCIMESWHF